VEFGDQLEIMCQSSQLGRASQFQFDTFVEVERRGQVIGLYPYKVPLRRRFDQKERIDDPLRVGILQQPFTIQTVSLDRLGKC
jgi:hypothetical protein